MAGLRGPLVMALVGGVIQAGFDEVALALKRRAESTLETPAADRVNIVEEKEYPDG